jgi:Domain of unknown function (DUF1854)
MLQWFGNSSREAHRRFRLSEASLNVDAAALKFALDQRGRLMAENDRGDRFMGLTPLRLFPMTDPDNWITIFDEVGKELCCVPSIAALDPKSATALRTALSDSEFIPTIQRVVKISGNDPPCRWLVETDRGTTEFIIKDEKDLRRLSEWKVLIVDARGIRYSVPDVRKLNAYGRRAVEWHV